MCIRDRYLIAATLKCVVAQRLVRRLCDACATWHAPAESEQALLGASVTRVRSAAGCESCAGTGYRGRLAVTELLVMREAMAQAFTEGASLAQLRAMARADGSRSLQDDGVRAVREGWTSVAELARVLSDEHGA